ncbi:DUF6225 family protein [Streptomyces sp. NPDC056323]|uniref:DUF6225 family protein n=1 Tax=unclassified Streptomyces TaxID=2593676 RepID=UPI0035E06E7E
MATPEADPTNAAHPYTPNSPPIAHPWPADEHGPRAGVSHGLAGVCEATPPRWNAAQLRDALMDLPDDAPIHIGVAGDPDDFDGYRDFVLVGAHQVENWWPANSTAPERTETAEALTLFADWEPGAYDRLD